MQDESHGCDVKAGEDQATDANPALDHVADLLGDEMLASSRGPCGALWREIRAMTTRMIESELSRRGKAPDGATEDVAAAEGDQGDECVEAFEADQEAAQLDIQVSRDELGSGDTIYDQGPFTVNECDVKRIVRGIHGLVCGYRLRHVERIAAAAGVADGLKFGAVSDLRECGDNGFVATGAHGFIGVNSPPAVPGRTVRGHRVPAET